MYEIDFLPIERTGEQGSRSGDSICFRFAEPSTGETRVVVIDGGYGYNATPLVEHIIEFYQTTHIDLMISTHPDADHINGLATVMDTLTVGELLMHNPHDHAKDTSDFSNIEVVDALLGLADEKGVPVNEPFTGLTRFGGHIRVLGPTQSYYEELVAQHLIDAALTKAGLKEPPSEKTMLSKSVEPLAFSRETMPEETLGEGGETGPRNNSSVITLLTVDGDRLLFTGDAGVPALGPAWDEYEATVGPAFHNPLDFFQAPHHGSKRNLGTTLLNRMFGEPGTWPVPRHAFISSAKNDPDHPSPKVVNALTRRGFDVFATEGTKICHPVNATPRPGWATMTPLPPLDEDVD